MSGKKISGEQREEGHGVVYHVQEEHHQSYLFTIYQENLIHDLNLTLSTPILVFLINSYYLTLVRLSVVLGPLLASLVAGAEARREDQVMARRGRQQQMTEDEINIKMLGISVPGSPGQDYPILATVPDTSFRSPLSVT